MVDENTGDGVPPSNASGTSGDGNSQENDNKGIPPERGETISRSYHRREVGKLVDEVHSFKTDNQKLREELDKRDTDKLTAEKKFKELWENSETKLKSVVEENTTLVGAVRRTHQYDKVKNFAVEAGLRAEALGDLELLEMSGVTVSNVNGRFEVTGAKEFVETLKSTKPHWFKEAQAPNVNAGGGAPPGTPTELTPEYMIELEVKDPKKYTELFPTYVKQATARLRSR